MIYLDKICKCRRNDVHLRLKKTFDEFGGKEMSLIRACSVMKHTLTSIVSLRGFVCSLMRLANC